MSLGVHQILNDPKSLYLWVRFAPYLQFIKILGGYLPIRYPIEEMLA